VNTVTTALELLIYFLGLAAFVTFIACVWHVAWTGKLPWREGEEEIVNETGKDLCQKQQ
jgi:hypothetical protein